MTKQPGKKLIVVSVDPDVHLKFKLLATMAGTNMAESLRNLIERCVRAGSIKGEPTLGRALSKESR